MALPLGRRTDRVCDALTRRIQGLPEGAMRTLTWDQGREMARHQRLTRDTGVEVFFAHPHSPCGVVRKLLTVCLCGFCPGRLV